MITRGVGFSTLRVVVLVGCGLFFIVPLWAMLDFSSRDLLAGDGRTWAAWTLLATDPLMRAAIGTSLILSLITVVLMLVLLVPTLIWVRLRVPWMARPIEFLSLLPLTVPPLVLIVGLRNVTLWLDYLFGDTANVLAFLYVVLVLPYAYRAIDSGLAAIDVTTLAEAARSLGSSWLRVIIGVVVPNIRTALLSATFISIALVLGEFTFASLLNYRTLPVIINQQSKVNTQEAVAASLASIVFAVVLLLILSVLSGGRRQRSAVDLTTPTPTPAPRPGSTLVSTPGRTEPRDAG